MDLHNILKCVYTDIDVYSYILRCTHMYLLCAHTVLGWQTIALVPLVYTYAFINTYVNVCIHIYVCVHI